MNISCEPNGLRVTDSSCGQRCVIFYTNPFTVTISGNESSYISLIDSRRNVLTIENSDLPVKLCGKTYNNLTDLYNELVVKSIGSEAELISQNPILVTNDDSTYEAQLAYPVIIGNTTDGDIDVVLPNISDIPDGFRFQVVFYEGVNNINVSVKNGTDKIGDKTMQELRVSGHAITVQANKQSDTPEYLIVQDSRSISKITKKIYKARDLQGTLDSSILYVVDANINMGTTSVNVPSGGLRLKFESNDLTGLFSTADNYTMFVGANAGNIFFLGDGGEIEVSGTNSKVFDLVGNTGNETMDLRNINFRNSTLGTAKGFRQLVLNNQFWSGNNSPLKLQGEWNGISIDRVRGVDQEGGFIEFQQGGPDAFLLTGRMASNANFDFSDPSAIMYNFAESNFKRASPALDNKAAVQLQGGDFNGVGQFCSLDTSSVYVTFKNNGANVRDTTIGATLEFQEDGVTPGRSGTTPITVTGQFEKMVCTTGIQNAIWTSDLDKAGVQQDNHIRYEGGPNQDFRAEVTCSLSGTNGDVAAIRLALYDEDDTLLQTAPAVTSTMNGGGGGNRAENIKATGVFLDVKSSDYIAVQVANNTAPRDINTLVSGSVGVEKR